MWSIDNELAEKERQKARPRRRKGRRAVRGKRGKDGRVMVSGAMLMEVETVLQAQVTPGQFLNSSIRELILGPFNFRIAPVF